MVLPARHRTFGADDLDAVVAEMQRLASGANGGQWINIEPDVDRSELHTGSIFWRIFSSRGPVVPRFTWVPAHVANGRSVHCEIGILHATGRDVTARLSKHGAAVPAGWHVLQDHVKRGVLIAVPPQADERSILAWALRSLDVLSPFPLSASYVAAFHGEPAVAGG